MAHLSLDNEGHLVLEAPFDDPHVERALRGPLLAFVVIERTDNAVVLDRVENNVEAVDYLTATVEQAGMELTLGADLEAIISSHGAERAQLEAARRSEQPKHSASARSRLQTRRGTPVSPGPRRGKSAARRQSCRVFSSGRGQDDDCSRHFRTLARKW